MNKFIAVFLAVFALFAVLLFTPDSEVCVADPSAYVIEAQSVKIQDGEISQGANTILLEFMQVCYSDICVQTVQLEPADHQERLADRLDNRFYLAAERVEGKAPVLVLMEPG